MVSDKSTIIQRTSLKAEDRYTGVTKTWRRLTPAPRLNPPEDYLQTDCPPVSLHPTVTTLLEFLNSGCDRLDNSQELDTPTDYLMFWAFPYPDFIQTAKRVINTIAQKNKRITEESDIPWASDEIFPVAEGMQYFTVDQKIKISPVAHPVMEMLKGIDASRIRKCLVCEKFFWAGRNTAKCCSRRCNHTHFMRESRSEEKKERRRENRKHRETLKARRRQRDILTAAKKGAPSGFPSKDKS